MLPSLERIRATYRSMVAARCCDVVETSLVNQGLGSVHLGGKGAEINAILNCFLAEGDRLCLHWRDRALRLARGMGVAELAAGFFSVSGTEGGGRNFTCHESSRANRIYPIATPAGSQCLPACGLAWDQILSDAARHTSNLTVCSLGEGSTRQGEVLEAIAFSLERHLPLLFIVIDNSYAISTRTAGRTAMDLGLIPPTMILSCKGWEIDHCWSTYRNAVLDVRDRRGPKLLHLSVPRLGSHTSNDDHRIYRSESELASIERHDPLKSFEVWLVNNEYISVDELLGTQSEAYALVQGVYQHMASNKDGLAASSNHDLEAPVSKPKDGLHSGGVFAEDCTRLRDAVNGSLRMILQTHPDAILFGEDVEDPLGGVFRLTQGLSSEFPGRVINAPLAEASILGVCCGLATGGRLAIAEIQFIDFIAPGWNQLVTNIATQRWRTEHIWNCPIVLYAPADGYCPGEGNWHSQVNASQFSRHHDLVVVMPSNPVDAWNSFLAASNRSGPTLILLPKAQLWKRFGPAQIESLYREQPFEGDARILTRGDRLTIVAWGNSAAMASQLVGAMGGSAIEVIDACYLNPIDLETIACSVERTTRLLVIDPEHDGASLGNYIGLKVREKVDGSEVRVLHRKLPMLGCGSQHERASLIYEEDIAAAIRAMGI